MYNSTVGCGEDITYIIVSVGISRVTCRFQKLSLAVVGVGNRPFPSLRVGEDIA